MKAIRDLPPTPSACGCWQCLRDAGETPARNRGVRDFKGDRFDNATGEKMEPGEKRQAA